jgi:hypothetical protein
MVKHRDKPKNCKCGRPGPISDIGAGARIAACKVDTQGLLTIPRWMSRKRKALKRLMRILDNDCNITYVGDLSEYEFSPEHFYIDRDTNTCKMVDRELEN